MLGIFITNIKSQSDVLAKEQRKDSKVQAVIQFLTDGTLPEDEKLSRAVIRQSSLFILSDDVLYYLDPKRGHRRAVVPKTLCEMCAWWTLRRTLLRRSSIQDFSEIMVLGGNVQ